MKKEADEAGFGVSRTTPLPGRSATALAQKIKEKAALHRAHAVGHASTIASSKVSRCKKRL